MTDTFQKTLTSVVTGVRQIEEFAGVLVGAAVEDALLCVARDYGHDYAQLRKAYAHRVVSRHTSGSVSDKTRCKGTARTGKQCARRAQIQGYCSTHAAELAAEMSKQNKLTAYKSDTNAIAPVSDLTKTVVERVMGPCARRMIKSTSPLDALSFL